jgi:hypothetical protein
MKSIVCPRCGRRSYNVNDIRQRYCGHCHMHHDDMDDDENTPPDPLMQYLNQVHRQQEHLSRFMFWIFVSQCGAVLCLVGLYVYVLTR